MKETTVYLPVKVEEEKPECNNQHGDVYSSGNLFLITKHELAIGDYYQKGKHGNNGWKRESEHWTEDDVTHWLKPQQGYFFTKEELEKLLSDAMDEAKVISTSQNFTEGLFSRLKRMYLERMGLK